MQYRLPLGARQGAGQWYLVRLHARIRFTATPRSGFVDLIAGTNGNTCALVEFVKQAGAPLRWSSVSWVEGRQRGHDTGSVVDVQMTNFLQTSGVRGGVNELSFKVFQPTALKVSSVEILPDSGILITDRSPPQLVAFIPDTDYVTARVGDTVNLPVIVRNVGAYAAPDVAVGLVAEDDGVDIVSMNPVEVGRVPREYRAAFRVELLRAGVHRIHVVVDSSVNRPQVVLALSVAPAATSSGAARIAITAAIMVAGLALAAEAIRRRRRPVRIGQHAEDGIAPAEEWRPTLYAAFLIRAAAVLVLVTIGLAFAAYGGYLIDRTMHPHGETPSELLVSVGLGSLAIGLLFAVAAVLALAGGPHARGWGILALVSGGASAIPFAGLFGGVGYLATGLLAILAVTCATFSWRGMREARRSHARPYGR